MFHRYILVISGGLVEKDTFVVAGYVVIGLDSPKSYFTCICVINVSL